MINIRELLQKRAGYAVSSHEDAWIKEVLYSDNIEEWVIVPSGFLYSCRMQSELNAVTEKYMIAGVYNVGSPFIDTGVRFELFFASPFWTLLQNIFGHCCMSILDKVAKCWPALNRPAEQALQTL